MNHPFFPANLQNIFLVLWAICCNICIPGSAFSQDEMEIEFKDQGKLVKKLDFRDLATLTPIHSIKIVEVHEQSQQTYKAFPARNLFDKTFGKKWEAAEEIVFVSLDGYQASIPVAKFLSHDAYFAFAHDDHSPFTMTNRLQGNEIVPLGPLYLIWDNMKSKILLQEGASDMPYQIKSIELATFASQFPGLSPPANSSAAVRRGFLHFRKYCMPCHTINGTGGNKGPELNYPASVVEYIRPEYLIRWIENPSGIRFNTRMPALAQKIPNRARISKEIVAYLKTMKRNKRKPTNPNTDQ